MQLVAAGTAGAVGATVASPWLPGISLAAAQVGEISATSYTRDPSGIQFVDVTYVPAQTGYWLLSSVGRVFAIDAPLHGDSPSLWTGETAVALASTPDGAGYWMFSSQGRVFAFGDATSYGDLDGIALAGDVIDGVALAGGTGYYMLGADGGIFSFGAAEFHGSIPQVLPGVVLDQPVVGIVPHDSTGYWLVAADGGVFAFGAAPFRGSVPQVLTTTALSSPIIGSLSSGAAYLMVGADGGIFNFGDSVFHGSRPGLGVATPNPAAVTAVDAVDDGSGYMMIDRTGIGLGFGSVANPGNGHADGPEVRDTHHFLAAWFDGSPFRWPSAEPIHFVINNDIGPLQAIDIILSAVADISNVTGIQFVYDGLTSEFIDHRLLFGRSAPRPRESYQPPRYGDRWAPVWIGARQAFADLESLATATAVSHLSIRSTQTITAVIDGELVSTRTGEPTWVSGHIGYHWGEHGKFGLDDLPSILKHELGHILGLNHSGEANQLMAASLGPVRDFRGGDLAGLHVIGAGNSHPPAPHPSEGDVIRAVGGELADTGMTPTGQCRGSF